MTSIVSVTSCSRRRHSCAVEVDARGLQPGPVTSECMAEALVMNGQPDEALELIHRQCGLGGDEALHQHRDMTTVLKASPWPDVPRTSSASPRVIQSGASTNSSKI